MTTNASPAIREARRGDAQQIAALLCVTSSSPELKFRQ